MSNHTRGTMRAAFYDRMGPARAVLTVGELAMPQPLHGEVLIKVEASGVNPHLQVATAKEQRKLLTAA